MEIEQKSLESCKRTRDYEHEKELDDSEDEEGQREMKNQPHKYLCQARDPTKEFTILQANTKEAQDILGEDLIRCIENEICIKQGEDNDRALEELFKYIDQDYEMERQQVGMMKEFDIDDNDIADIESFLQKEADRLPPSRLPDRFVCDEAPPIHGFGDELMVMFDVKHVLEYFKRIQNDDYGRMYELESSGLKFVLQPQFVRLVDPRPDYPVAENNGLSLGKVHMIHTVGELFGEVVPIQSRRPKTTQIEEEPKQEKKPSEADKNSQNWAIPLRDTDDKSLHLHAKANEKNISPYEMAQLRELQGSVELIGFVTSNQKKTTCFFQSKHCYQASPHKVKLMKLLKELYLLWYKTRMMPLDYDESEPWSIISLENKYGKSAFEKAPFMNYETLRMNKYLQASSS